MFARSPTVFYCAHPPTDPTPHPILPPTHDYVMSRLHIPPFLQRATTNCGVTSSPHAVLQRVLLSNHTYTTIPRQPGATVTQKRRRERKQKRQYACGRIWWKQKRRRRRKRRRRLPPGTLTLPSRPSRRVHDRLALHSTIQIHSHTGERHRLQRFRPRQGKHSLVNNRADCRWLSLLVSVVTR